MRPLCRLLQAVVVVQVKKKKKMMSLDLRRREKGRLDVSSCKGP